MDLGGVIPLLIGVLFIIVAIGNWNWVMKKTGPFLIKFLKKEGARGLFVTVGLFFVIVGISLLFLKNI
jgi:hypothetical protein